MEDKKARPWDIFNRNIHKVSIETSEHRMNICKECPFFAKATGICKKCNCLMVVKTRLPHAYCPVKKWDKIKIGGSLIDGE